MRERWKSGRGQPREDSKWGRGGTGSPLETQHLRPDRFPMGLGLRGKDLGDVSESTSYSHDKGHRDATGQRDNHVKPPQSPGEIDHAVTPLRTGEDGHVDNSCSSVVVLATPPLPDRALLYACMHLDETRRGRQDEHPVDRIASTVNPPSPFPFPHPIITGRAAYMIDTADG